MSEIYTVSAKTVDEAMELASKLYGGNNKEISYDIVSLPKKGFLGIGSKDAVIRVTVSEEADAELSSIVNDLKSYKAAPESGYYSAENEKSEEKAEKKQERSEKPQPAKNAKAEKAPEKNPEKAPEKNTQNESRPQRKPKAQSQPKKPKVQPDKPQAEKPVKAEAAENAEAVKSAEKEKKRAVSREEMDFAKNFINSVIADMHLSAAAVEVEAAEGEEFITAEGLDVYPAVNIVGDDTGILIGHHGETLDAIQYLVNLALFRRSNSKGDGRENIKITVDIENYREKREDTLRSLARRMAARAVKYKKNVFLEPMNPYERRIIHSELQDYPDVATHSVGSDTNRKIIITYEGTDKAPQNRRKRNGRRPYNANAVKESPAEPETPVAIPLPSLDDTEA